jgi:hypothetical protein
MAGTCFVVCIANGGYESSLELRKLICVHLTRSAENIEQIRIVDESGEDYLFPASFFEPIDVSESLQKKLLHAA